MSLRRFPPVTASAAELHPETCLIPAMTGRVSAARRFGVNLLYRIGTVYTYAVSEPLQGDDFVVRNAVQCGALEQNGAAFSAPQNAIHEKGTT
jgi:hypothetical protein